MATSRGAAWVSVLREKPATGRAWDPTASGTRGVRRWPAAVTSPERQPLVGPVWKVLEAGGSETRPRPGTPPGVVAGVGVAA